MAAFSPVALPYDIEDKEFGYPTQILEEPFTDLFDQYLTQTISDLGDHGFEARDAEFLDLFTDGDTTSSASYATDSTSSAPLQPKYNTLRDRSRQVNAACLSKTAFVPQNYRGRGRREKLLPAVSGLELLLDIEGRGNTAPLYPDPPHSAPATLTSLPLRRKPRFSTSKSKDARDRNHRVSKTPIHPIKEQPNMPMPQYSYRRESPRPQEWTHALEQPASQGAVNQFPPPSPTTAMPDYYDDITHGCQSPQMTLREQFLQGESNDGAHTQKLPHGLDPGMDATSHAVNFELQQPKAEEQYPTYEGFHEYIQSLQFEPSAGQRHPYHSASWESSNSDVTYTLATGQNPSDWNDEFTENGKSYYSHHHASKSAPALPYPSNTDTSAEYLPATTGVCDTLVYENSSTNGMIQSLDSFTFDSEPHQYPPPPTPGPFPAPAQERSQSPTKRTSSSAAQASPGHTRRRSKSAPRRKSAGNLKTPKSPATMGFVNFTPSDSKRILTGVAPSGSSKTKARREQEANEKKRKLSLAVLRAVEEAGGDPEPLRKEGLFIDG
ncbi:MAG: hypothetical protein L6R39_000330 [Caloplaca ligustica]|nr:MAG: hypothetical protein L6R39_000330 [Caloplaca ligustica]